MLSNIPYIMNLFFYNGNIERSILSVQYKSSTLQGSDGRPEIVGKYGYYDPQTGEGSGDFYREGHHVSRDIKGK